MNTCATNIPIALASNQEQLDQWVHLLPRGQFYGRDGRGPWMADDIDSIIEGTRVYAGKNLLAVDYEHQIDKSAENGKPAPAAGWLKGLQARENGLWGLVEWTVRASEQIKSKEYRYLSPVFNFHPKSGRIVRLLRAGLTNSPALELTALAKAEGATMDEETLSTLRQLLGLGEDADPAAIVQAVSDLVANKPGDDQATEELSSHDPGRYVPIGDFKNVVSELQQLRASTSEQEVARAVTDALNKRLIPPSLESWATALCRADRSAFETFIEEVSPLFRALRGTQTGGKPPEDRLGRTSLSDAQKAVCDAMGLEYTAYAKTIGR